MLLLLLRQIPAGAVLETVYYRYLYFTEDGRVLYALTPTPPPEMFPRLRRVCLTRQNDAAAVWGTYRVHKARVTVTARQEWQHVQLTLRVVDASSAAAQDHHARPHGRCGCLSFDRHVSSASGNFGGGGGDDCDRRASDRIVYEVPAEPFRFIKDKRL